MRHAGGIAALALAVLLLSPLAAAYHGQPARAGLVVEGPVDVEGSVEAHASPGAAYWQWAPGFAASLDARRIDVELHEWRAGDGPLALLAPEGARATRAAHEGAHVRFDARGDAFQFLVFQSGPSLVRATSDDGGRLVAHPPGGVAPSLDAREDGLDRFGDALFLWGLDREGARFEAPAPRVEASGDFTIFLYDGDATLRDAQGAETYATGADERRVAYALLHVRGGALTVAPTSGFHALYGGLVETTLNGTARLPLARGSAVVDGQQVTTDGPTALQGVLEATFAPAREAQALRVEAHGDLTAFAVPGATHRFDPPVAGISLALLALGALAWFVKGGGAAALYSRFAGPQVLGHAERERALALLRERPGLSVADLAHELGVSWSTASYHLGVLEREGMVVGERRGRHKRYALVGSGVDREALAVSAHPTARALLDAIGARPGISQADLAQRVGITASTASWHLQRLSRAGLVRVRKEWRTARYDLPAAAEGAA